MVLALRANTRATHAMINPRYTLLSFLAALSSPLLAQTPFTYGNLVVLRVGDGLATLTPSAAPMFLDEYTPTGVLVQSIPLPTTGSGTNHAITVRGNGTSEAYLGNSTNGLYFLAFGYDAPAGTSDLFTAGAFASSVNRVIARIDLIGNIDTSTALADAYSGANNGAMVTLQGNPRAVAI